MKDKTYGNEKWKEYNRMVASDGSGFVDCSLVVSPTEMTGAIPVMPSTEADANSYEAMGIEKPKPGTAI